VHLRLHVDIVLVAVNWSSNRLRLAWPLLIQVIVVLGHCGVELRNLGFRIRLMLRNPQ
jgi:hypothetical protein